MPRRRQKLTVKDGTSLHFLIQQRARDTLKSRAAATVSDHQESRAVPSHESRASTPRAPAQTRINPSCSIFSGDCSRALYTRVTL